MRVATVLRKLWVVASGTPSCALTERHSFKKLFWVAKGAGGRREDDGLLAEIGEMPPLLQHLDRESRQWDGAVAGGRLGFVDASEALAGYPNHLSRDGELAGFLVEVPPAQGK